MLLDHKTILSTQTTSMPNRVQDLLARFTALWWDCDARQLPPGPLYTPQEQVLREKQMDRFLQSVAVAFDHPPRNPTERQTAQDRLLAAAREMARHAFGFDDPLLDALNAPVFAEVATRFAQEARRFDPKISPADIYQACRNVTTTNMLQLLMGLPVALTPGIFAYSLLYPYSDNYLDNPRLSREAKLAFSQRFRRRLEGEAVAPTNPSEEKIFDLVSLIESQFDRAASPQLFDSLLAIHDAQVKSVHLLRRDASPYDVDVLGIALEKGGTSVLADGYLAAGDLTPNQAAFTFGLGAFLQLGDDLEDVQPDIQDGLMTIFSVTAPLRRLDAATTHLMNFVFRVLDLMDEFAAPGTELVQEFVRQCVFQPFAVSVHRARRYYSPHYLKEIEHRSPFRFAHLQKQSRWLHRRRAALGRMIEAFATPDELPT
jgi:hypothetical protein